MPSVNHGGWHDPLRSVFPTGDPILADSALWDELLRRAAQVDPQLAGNLRGFRCAGCRLVPEPGRGCRLVPRVGPEYGYRTRAEYEAARAKWLMPYRNLLQPLLEALGPGGNGGAGNGGGSPLPEKRGGEAAPRGSGVPPAGGAREGEGIRPAAAPAEPARPSFDRGALQWRLGGLEDLAGAVEAARRAGLCALDTETAVPPGPAIPAGWARAGEAGDGRKAAPLDPHLGRVRLLQAAVPGQPALVVDLAPLWGDRAKLQAALAPLLALLADPAAIKVFHNAKFDLKMLRGTLGRRFAAENLFDTMLAGQLLACGLWPEEGFGLAAMCRRHLGVALDKSGRVGDFSGDLSEAQLRYAALDAAILLPLHSALAAELAREGLERAARLEFDCAPAVADMEYAGFGFDREAWAELEREVREAHAAARARALALFPPVSPQRDLFGAEGLNPDSPQQVLESLRRLGARVRNTRDETLRALARAGGPAGEAAAVLSEYRKQSKALSAFVKPMWAHVHPATGRVHPEYRQLNRNGVGRFSAADPNIQQVPREAGYRRAFVAPAGRRLVIADYSAIEMRIMAWLSGDAVLTEVFRSGADPHRRTASLLTGKPEEEVSREERQSAKACSFGLIYGMSAATLKEYALNSYGVEMSEEEAVAFRRRFFEAYRGVRKWHEKQDREARAAREVRTASGRCRRWRGSDMPATELFNSPDQGTGADILKRAMARLRWPLAALGAEIVASVHDELVAECP
ncbi:MAG: DNA polymerase, partial [Planctomycetota bacterium]